MDWYLFILVFHAELSWSKLYNLNKKDCDLLITYVKNQPDVHAELISNTRIDEEDEGGIMDIDKENNSSQPLSNCPTTPSQSPTQEFSQHHH